MFELHDVSLLAAAKPEERVLLGDVSAVFPPGELVAVAGPSGSGKSLLLQLLAGVRVPTFGEVLWTGASPRPPVAYRSPSLPSGTSRAEEWLTPAEQIASALRLRVAGLSREEMARQTAELLEKTGLSAVAEVRGGALTRDQRRRLDLALELTGSPGLLLWDDPEPEPGPEFDHLLQTLAAELKIAIVRVTASLDWLDDFDAVLVLSVGQLAYYGAPLCIGHYFQIDTPGQLYRCLGERSPEEWQRSWAKHGPAFGKPLPPEPLREKVVRAGAWAQCRELFRRRWTVAWRDRVSLGWQLTFVAAFPLAAAVFVLGGLPRFFNLAGQLHGDVVTKVREQALLALDATYGARLATGLALAQFVLLAFLTARFAAREIAGERRFLEIGKYRGLRVAGYVAARAAFLLPSSVFAALWMGVYVHWVCRLPGSLAVQAGVLALANAAFAALCLAVSSFARSGARAGRCCFALAVLQLPFAGVLLAPPEWLSWMLRPLSTVYWGANAYLEAMNGTQFYEVLQMVSPTSPLQWCLGMLALQLALGLGMAWIGCLISHHMKGVGTGRSGT